MGGLFSIKTKFKIQFIPEGIDTMSMVTMQLVGQN